MYTPPKRGRSIVLWGIGFVFVAPLLIVWEWLKEVWDFVLDDPREESEYLDSRARYVISPEPEGTD